MNRLEVQETIKQFGRMQPGYMSWRTDRLQAAAVANGVDAAGEWSAMLDSFARTLTAISREEGERVIQRMESGALKVPPYGELALTVLREAKIARQPANRHYDSQPKHTCLVCRDSGLANVWDPNFVEAFRDEFAKITRSEVDRSGMKSGCLNLDRFDPDGTVTAWRYDPTNWESAAAGWWRRRGGSGSIHHIVLCNCSCRRQGVLSVELALFRSNDRRSLCDEKAGPPACGQAKYDPTSMPLKTPLSFDDLHDWYATHQPGDIHEWKP